LGLGLVVCRRTWVRVLVRRKNRSADRRGRRCREQGSWALGGQIPLVNRGSRRWGLRVRAVVRPSSLATCPDPAVLGTVRWCRMRCDAVFESFEGTRKLLCKGGTHGFLDPGGKAERIDPRSVISIVSKLGDKCRQAGAHGLFECVGGDGQKFSCFRLDARLGRWRCNAG